MNTTVKRIAQMAAVYAAKQAWNAIDKDQAMKALDGLYKTTPEQWEKMTREYAGRQYDAARNSAVSSANAARDGAIDQLDVMLSRMGLIRQANVSTSAWPIAIGVAAGVSVGVAGAVYLLKTESGQSILESIEGALKRASGGTEYSDSDSEVSASDDESDEGPERFHTRNGRAPVSGDVPHGFNPN